MSKQLIVCLQSLAAQDVERMAQIVPDWEIAHGTDKEVLKPRLREAEIVIGWGKSVLEECFQPGSNLRWVQAWGAGVDRIPLEKFIQHGVMLTNASGVHAFPISETIFAMMLSFARKMHHTTLNQAQGKWVNVGELGEIHGATIGILGIGAIGEETARLAKAFGMKVLGFRQSGQPSPFVDQMYDRQGLREMLVHCDYVINTLPLTKDTQHLMGAEQFQAMKASAYYINIGRGGTTDTSALIEAIKNKGIAGAGLDVFEKEPLEEDSPLWQMDNVIMTPHNSGSTVHYHERAMEIVLRNLQDYVQGRTPSRNLVNLEKQY
jgi:phosphoglycerate dehydrogenase-like enzyme